MNEFLFTTKQWHLLIQSIKRSKSLLHGARIHAILTVSGLLSKPTPILSDLTAFYALSGRLAYAHHLFDKIPEKTTQLYNALIRGHVDSGLHSDALCLFDRMLASGCNPDNFTFPFVVKACGQLSLRSVGNRVHGMCLTCGFSSDEYAGNTLIAMYMNCGDVGAAVKVFDRMPQRSVISWNTVIVGYCDNGNYEDALMVFEGMVGAGMEVDGATVVPVLRGCTQLRDLRRGRMVHKLVDEKGLGVDVFVRNSLIDFYAKCGKLDEARNLFNSGTWEGDIVSWTTIIGGYALQGDAGNALNLACQMQLAGIRPNHVTMACLLSACTSLPSLKHAKCIHGLCIRLRLEWNIAVETALIDLYMKRNSALSTRVFLKSSRRTATWNALISGFSRNGQSEFAINFFKQMLRESIRPDVTTIASLLPAYAEAADLKQAVNIHCYLVRMGFAESTENSTGLLDIYAKSGNLDVALELFNGLKVKDFVAWTAIITGYGMHGHARTAVSLFDQMLEFGVAPSEVTFTSLLYSCSHCGLVDEGLQLFNRMVNVHGLSPNADHYACMVDMLGRAGRVREAYDLISGMPFEPNQSILGALLGACVIHENVEFGEFAARQLFEIEPENTGNYVLLANMYATLGRWKDVEAVRNLMAQKGLRKCQGSSLIEATHV